MAGRGDLYGSAGDEEEVVAPTPKREVKPREKEKEKEKEKERERERELQPAPKTKTKEPEQETPEKSTPLKTGDFVEVIAKKSPYYGKRFFISTSDNNNNVWLFNTKEDAMAYSSHRGTIDSIHGCQGVAAKSSVIKVTSYAAHRGKEVPAEKQDTSTPQQQLTQLVKARIAKIPDEFKDDAFSPLSAAVSVIRRGEVKRDLETLNELCTITDDAMSGVVDGCIMFTLSWLNCFISLLRRV